MRAGKKRMRTIWPAENGPWLEVIDQRRLPHKWVTVELKTVTDAIWAIKEMVVRGAPLIGVTAAYAMYLAALNSPPDDIPNDIPDDYLMEQCEQIKSARPTAVNLFWAADRVLERTLAVQGRTDRIAAARAAADEITEAEVDNCKRIGQHGLPLIEEISARKKDQTVNILTHCNAGWLACIEHGTATAPIYAAHEKGIDVHVWVDETRPLNQGSRLTAWELGRQGVKHTVITDNAGGHLMQHRMVDMVLVGSDRTTYTGDVANKIGTYLKALAAKDNHIPFYVALPSSTIDWQCKDGVNGIPVEERDPYEVRFVRGLYADAQVDVLITPDNSPAANFAFDVTPARLVTGLITERGICKAAEKDVRRLFSGKH